MHRLGLITVTFTAAAPAVHDSMALSTTPLAQDVLRQASRQR
jgi:hypothetical protein